MRYFFKFNFRWVRFAIFIISVVLTFGCFQVNALSTDEIIENLVLNAGKRDCISDQDSEFIGSFVEQYYKSLQLMRARIGDIRLFRDHRIFDCLKYTILLNLLHGVCEACSAHEDFCSEKCMGCLVHWVFERTESERKLYDAISPEFYRFNLLRL